MTLKPISLRHARAFVAGVHRHHDAPQGGKFALAAWHDAQLVGVAIVGRPVSRMLDDGLTAEVIRVGDRRHAERLFVSLRGFEARGASDGVSQSAHLHVGRGVWGQPSSGWLGACRRVRRRQLERPESAARGSSPIATEDSVGV
jgi:hypothetical protein